MNKEIKIIGLLNMIAEGKEVPEKFIYNDHVWVWCEPCNIYETIEGKETINLYDWFSDEGNLNDTVEIIEEDNNKIEKLKYHNSIPDEEDIKDYKQFIKEILKNENCLMDKTNEIIDKINNL